MLLMQEACRALSRAWAKTEENGSQDRDDRDHHQLDQVKALRFIVLSLLVPNALEPGSAVVVGVPPVLGERQQTPLRLWAGSRRGLVPLGVPVGKQVVRPRLWRRRVSM